VKKEYLEEGKPKRGASVGAANPKPSQRFFVWSKASKSWLPELAVGLPTRLLGRKGKGAFPLEREGLLHEGRNP